MPSSFYPVHWLVLDPAGLSVRGQHHPETLPVHPRLQDAFDAQWPQVLQRVLATPGGFDGKRAALVHWQFDPAGRGRPAQLSLTTGFRTYTQGTTLKKLMAQDALWSEDFPQGLPPGLQPEPSLSWGSSLTTVVLLPNGRVLAGQRGQHMQANPGRWACVFTEILEPDDVSPWGMNDLLERLVEEELPLLLGRGLHRYVGLMLIPRSYTWTLVSVLDLRAEPADELDALLLRMKPDAETQAWASLALQGLPGLAEGALADDAVVEGLELARELSLRLS